MRFPLLAGAFALTLCATVCASAAAAPPALPEDACAPLAGGLPTAAAAEDLNGAEERAAAAARPAAPPATAPRAVKVALEDPERGSLLEDAYRDAHETLDRDGECGDFFGGRAPAQHVLSRLVEQLRDKSLPDASIGIKMSGGYTNVSDRRTGAQYRVFDEATVNRRGPFFRERAGADAMPNCGSFAPNTRGARAAMLLHELGHMMRGPGGGWLLPNDGDDRTLVAANSGRIEEKCGRSIRRLDARQGAEKQQGRLGK